MLADDLMCYCRGVVGMVTSPNLTSALCYNAAKCTDKISTVLTKSFPKVYLLLSCDLVLKYVVYYVSDIQCMLKVFHGNIMSLYVYVCL